MTNFKLMVLPLFICGSTSLAAGADNSLSTLEIVRKTRETFNFENHVSLVEKRGEAEAANESSFNNPDLQIGSGRVQSGINRGPYDTWAVSQSIAINGRKSLKAEQTRAMAKVEKIATIQGQQGFTVDVLKLAYYLQTLILHEQHLAEKLASLEVINNYLATGKFVSPNDQINKSLVQNAIQNISLEKSLLLNQILANKTKLSSLLNLGSNFQLHLKWMSTDEIAKHLGKLPKIAGSVQDTVKANDEMAESSATMASRGWVPDLNLEYSESFERMPGGNTNRTFMVGFKVPIFNFSRNQSRAATSRQEIVTIENSRLKAEAESESRQRISKVWGLMQVMGNYDDKFLARKNAELKKFLRLFKQGQVSAINYLELQSQIHNYHESAIDTRLQLQDEFLELCHLFNRELPLEEVFHE